MTLDQFKTLLDKLPLVAHIHLEGLGEPFLNKEFLSMVRMATNRGISVDTTTNATLLDERLSREALSSGLSRMFISMDGAKPETYEKIRVGARFDSVVSNLETLACAKKALQSPTELCLWFVGTDGNIQDLPHMVDMASDLEISVLYADATHDWGKVSVRDRLKAIDDTYRVQSCVEFAQMRAKELGVKLIINPMLERLVKDNMKREPCRWAWYSFYITVEGYVMPCCLRPDPQVWHMGNLFEKGFWSIWNSPQYMEFRRNLKQGVRPEFCKGCAFW
jgi:radical SAM protein with 4Fe4S-binding SPASM domain